jgi:GT2 family glycosyltransferase
MEPGEEDREILTGIHRELEKITLQLAWLHRGQRAVDERLDKIERSLLFRIVRWPGARYAHIRNRIDHWLGRSDSQYREWLIYERTTLFPGREECIRRVAAFANKPLITVVIATHGLRPGWLREAVASVTGQVYPLWELCICVDGTSDPATLALIDEVSPPGGPVRVVRHTSSMGISAALNSACSVASGEYIGFLDQDHVLSPYALFYVAEALQRISPALLYSDEDTLAADGHRVDPLFKPAWSPELLKSTMYMSHFLVISRAAWNAAGGFREGYEGSEDFDLCLRITAADDRVAHIPRILYHRRKAPGEAIQHRKIERTTTRLISIVICSRSPKLLRNVLSSIRSTTVYPAYEIIVAEHCPEGENPEMARIAAEFGCVRVPEGGPFNFSRLNNAASEQAKGDILLFLNDDIEPLRADWLSSMGSHLEVEAAGIVGARLLYPTGAIQHAGVVVGIGDGAGHVNRHRYTGVYWKWIDQTRDVSAVTGACLAIRAELFRQLGGFDAVFPNNYNDVDLCLRAREAGYRVVYEPAAVLRHYEGQTRELYVDYDEREKFYGRWHRVVEGGDPYYNPNLALEGEEAFLNFKVSQRDLEAR